MTKLDEYKIKDIQINCCDWKGQKTVSFSTLGKSEEDKKKSKKTDTHTVSEETTRL